MLLKLIFLSLVSGLLAALPWYGAGAFSLFIAFVPILYINHQVLIHRYRFSSLHFWFFAFIASLVWHFAVAWWGTKVSVAGAIFALIIYAFSMSLVWLLVHEAFRYKGEKFALVFFVFAWISYEYLQLNWDISWPWLIVGAGIGHSIKIIQWYEYTGVMGGTLWVLLVNILIWKILKNYVLEALSFRFIHGFQLFLLIVIPLSISIYKYENHTPQGDTIKIALLQPNIDPYTEKFSERNYLDQYTKLMELANEAVKRNDVSLIIGPETALHNVWLNGTSTHPGIDLIQSFMAEHEELAFVVGAGTLKPLNHETDKKYTSQFHADSLLWFEAFNSALYFDGPELSAVYHKSKLVAGVEKVPFGKYLGFLGHLTVDLGGMGSSLAGGNEIINFEHQQLSLASPICYESVYGEYLSNFVQQGANLILILTNDGWWDNTPGYHQHLFHSQIRAIELRRDVARAANTGISCFINQKGIITQCTDWWTQAVLTENVTLNNELTFYARHGDYIARIAVMMFILMGLSIWVAHKKHKKA